MPALHPTPSPTPFDPYLTNCLGVGKMGGVHRRLLALTRHHLGWLLLTAGSLWLAGLTTVLQAWLLSQVVAAIFLGGQGWTQVAPKLTGLLLASLARAGLSGWHEIGARTLAVHVKGALRQRLWEHIQALGPLYLKSERTGELTAVALEGIEALDAYFSQYLPQLLVTALVPLSIVTAVFTQDGFSGLIMVLTAPLIPLFMVLIGKGAEALTQRQYLGLRRLSAYFLDALQGLTTLKLLGQAKAYTARLAELGEAYRKATLKVLRLTFLSAFALELITTLSVAIIAVEISLRLLYGRTTFPAAFFVLILAPEFYLPFRLLGQRFHAGMDGVTAARRLFAILDTPTLRHPAPPSPTTAPLESVVFTEVSFTYPGATRPALDAITLELRAGETLALLGPSGAGKSTLAGLLLGFLQPSSGQIRTRYRDGTVHDGPPPPASLAWVPQHPHLFQGTLADNLRLACPAATPEAMAAALSAAGLADRVASLPAGLDTTIGEGGSRLSGGEAQRLALARAFLKDAPFLILDEPTAHLDLESESRLVTSTQRLLQGRTALVIAHRLQTVQHASRLVILDEGRVRAQGTPAELLARPDLQGYVRAAPPSRRPIAPSGVAPDSGAGTPLPLRPAEAVDFTLTPGQGILRRLLRFLRGSEGWLLLALLAGYLTVGANVALIGLSAWLIARAALQPPLGTLQLAIVGVRFFGLSRAVLRYVERLISHNVTFSLLTRLRVWLYQRLEPLAPARLEQEHSGDLLARILGDVATLEHFYVRVIGPVLIAGFTLWSLSWFLRLYGLELAGVVTASYLMAGAGLPLVINRAAQRPGRALITWRARLSALWVDGLQGLADLLASGQAEEHGRKLQHADAAYARCQLRLAWLSAGHTIASTLLAQLALWGVIALAIPQVQTGHIAGVLLGALGLLTLAAFEAVTPLPVAAQTWNSVQAAAQRLFELAATPPPVAEPAPLPVPPRPRHTGLSISGLTFRYPDQAHPALRDLTCTIAAGSAVAIVGPSGAGKSTLVHLLLRFWDYEEGEIRLGEVPLKALAPDAVREHFAVVSQQTYLFNASVEENLRLANPTASAEALARAVRLARFEEVLHRLPQGYATIIGEQGWRLSGGERQRLALARALLKDAPILLLDEPTAHLDPLNERLILEALWEIMRTRTTLWITHRLIGMERMEQILVLHQGELVEQGGHADLLARQGLYWRLWHLQQAEQLADQGAW